MLTKIEYSVGGREVEELVKSALLFKIYRVYLYVTYSDMPLLSI